MKSFFDMLSIQFQSKRTWATMISLLTVLGGMYFPDHLNEALAIAAILQSWAVSDAVRPAASKFSDGTKTQEPFEVPDEVLSVLRETMVENAIGSIATNRTLVENRENNVN